MNEKLSPIQQELLSRADSIFQSLAATAKGAYDIAADQLPDLAIQYITYGRVSSVVYTVIVIGTILLSFYISKKFGEATDWLILFPTVAISFTMLAIWLAKLPELIMVWAAPKIWLIQEIVKLVK